MEGENPSVVKQWSKSGQTSANRVESGGWGGFAAGAGGGRGRRAGVPPRRRQVPAAAAPFSLPLVLHLLSLLLGWPQPEPSLSSLSLFLRPSSLLLSPKNSVLSLSSSIPLAPLPLSSSLLFPQRRRRVPVAYPPSLRLPPAQFLLSPLSLINCVHCSQRLRLGQHLPTSDQSQIRLSSESQIRVRFESDNDVSLSQRLCLRQAPA